MTCPSRNFGTKLVKNFSRKVTVLLSSKQHRSKQDLTKRLSIYSEPCGGKMSNIRFCKLLMSNVSVSSNHYHTSLGNPLANFQKSSNHCPWANFLCQIPGGAGFPGTLKFNKLYTFSPYSRLRSFIPPLNIYKLIGRM